MSAKDELDSCVLDLSARTSILQLLLEKAEREIGCLQREVKMNFPIWEGSNLNLVMHQAYEITESIKALHTLSEQL